MSFIRFFVKRKLRAIEGLMLAQYFIANPLAMYLIYRGKYLEWCLAYSIFASIFALWCLFNLIKYKRV